MCCRVEHLRARHECGLVGGKVSCEQFMKLRRVDICETVGRFLYGARFGEAARKALSVLGLFLAGIGHVGCDIHQANNRWIYTRFRNYGSPIAVRNKDARSVLKSEDALRHSHVVLKGGLRFLNDADVEAVLAKNVVNAVPTGPIRPGPVHQNDVLYWRVRWLGDRVICGSKGE